VPTFAQAPLQHIMQEIKMSEYLNSLAAETSEVQANIDTIEDQITKLRSARDELCKSLGELEDTEDQSRRRRTRRSSADIRPDVPNIT
jgi:predicted  nucleic acid-binding Zn-ribbon protein